MAVRTSRDDRSLSELFSDLSNQLNTLVRQEMRLAQVEMSRKASDVGKNTTYMVLGGAVAYAGFLALMFAAIELLAEILPWWVSAVIVGVVIAAVGAGMLWKGWNDLKQTQLVPERTLETVKRDVQWAKEEIR